MHCRKKDEFVTSPVCVPRVPCVRPPPESSTAHHVTLHQVSVPGIPKGVRAACGADFSLVIDESGSLYSFGWSEFGQLGMGTDGEHNTSASSVKLSYEAEKTPQRVPGLLNVVQVAAGPHHVVALTACGEAYTWGCGGYGRLGHKDQADIWSPRLIPNVLFRTVVAGNAWCCGVGWQIYQRPGQAAPPRPSGQGTLFMWGRINPSKDAWMYPKPEEELYGWTVGAIASGHSHTAIAADQSVIVFGTGCNFGELGLGADGPKSSAKPRKVMLTDLSAPSLWAFLARSWIQLARLPISQRASAFLPGDQTQ